MIRTERIVSGLVGVLALVVLLAATACAGGNPTAGRVPQATPEVRKVAVEGGAYFEVDAAGLVATLKSKDFLLVNVHVPYAGEIEPTDLFIQYDQIEANLAKLPADKGAKVFLYCQSGHMSALASGTLVRLGYTNVWNLGGGMMGWQQAGHPLAQKAR